MGFHTGKDIVLYILRSGNPKEKRLLCGSPWIETVIIS